MPLLLTGSCLCIGAGHMRARGPTARRAGAAGRRRRLPPAQVVGAPSLVRRRHGSGASSASMCSQMPAQELDVEGLPRDEAVPLRQRPAAGGTPARAASVGLGGGPQASSPVVVRPLAPGLGCRMRAAAGARPLLAGAPCKALRPGAPRTLRACLCVLPSDYLVDRGSARDFGKAMREGLLPRAVLQGWRLCLRCCEVM